jgi:hypothetical protein
MEIDEDTIEGLARAIHANYLADFAPDGASWDNLDDDTRAANRDQARDIVAKLRRIGAEVSKSTVDGEGFEFSAAEIDVLARAEHERWINERTGAGWRLGPRNNRRKRHPSLVPWGDLSEHEREKDRQTVRHIPEVLATAGLRVVRPA